MGLASLPIAVFDSGVGGLTVLRECLVSLPNEDFVYLGDTARFPYGDRTPEELLAFSRELAGVLLARGAKLLHTVVRAGLLEEIDRRGHSNRVRRRWQR